VNLIEILRIRVTKLVHKNQSFILHQYSPEMTQVGIFDNPGERSAQSFDGQLILYTAPEALLVTKCLYVPYVQGHHNYMEYSRTG